MPYTPCKECEERTIGCHSKCKKFAKFSKENERIKKKRHMETIRRSVEWRQK